MDELFYAPSDLTALDLEVSSSKVSSRMKAIAFFVGLVLRQGNAFRDASELELRDLLIIKSVDSFVALGIMGMELNEATAMMDRDDAKIRSLGQERMTDAVNAMVGQLKKEKVSE